MKTKKVALLILVSVLFSQPVHASDGVRLTKGRRLDHSMIKRVFAESAENKRINITVDKLQTDVIGSGKVFAEISSETTVYNKSDTSSGKKAAFSKGDIVEIIQDITYIWYEVRNVETEVKGWVLAENLIIPEDGEPNKTPVSNLDIENYANSKELDSETDTLVIVDIGRQLVYILKGQKLGWEHYLTLTCASGKNVSPTITGSFKIAERGDWFFSARFNSGAKYWVRFQGAYLFHSVAMDKDKNITDDILGEKRSSGCIRLAVEDAKWFYDNIKTNTAVYIP